MGQKVVERLIPLLAYVQQVIPAAITDFFPSNMVQHLINATTFPCNNLTLSDQFFDGIKPK